MSCASFKISFKTSFISRAFNKFASTIIGATDRTLCCQALITEEGLVISGLLNPPVLIPWREVQCLDLSGLRQPDLRWIPKSGRFARFMSGTPSTTRFFLLMSENHRLLNSCHCGRNTWLPSINVLGITGIMADSAEVLLLLLKDIAARKKIRLETICLDFE